MSDTNYEDKTKNYNIVWIMNKLKLLCASADSNINKIYSAFHTLTDFYMIRQHSGETVTKYFNRFKSEQVNAELSRVNLTKHEELEKTERDYEKNTNPEKLAEDKFLSMALLECYEPVRYKTLWYSIRNNSLTGTDHYPKTLNY